jgi:hypothetical protein
LGKVDHEDIAEKLGAIDPELGARVKKLRQLRSQADYDPRFVEVVCESRKAKPREFQGSLEKFQLDARDRIDEGLTVFNRILGEIERGSRV